MSRMSWERELICFNEGKLMCLALTLNLKTGVWNSSFVKNRGPVQNLGVQF